MNKNRSEINWINICLTSSPLLAYHPNSAAGVLTSTLFNINHEIMELIINYHLGTDTMSILVLRFILDMGSANGIQQNNVTSSLTGWAHTQYDPVVIVGKHYIGLEILLKSEPSTWTEIEWDIKVHSLFSASYLWQKDYWQLEPCRP